MQVAVILFVLNLFAFWLATYKGIPIILVMGVLNNGMSILGVGSDWQMAIKGSVLLAAVAFDIISKNKAK